MKDHRPHLKIPNATWDYTTKDDCKLETDLKSTSQVYCRHSADALPVENDVLGTNPQLRPHRVPRSLMMWCTTIKWFTTREEVEKGRTNQRLLLCLKRLTSMSAYRFFSLGFPPETP